jgi:acyl carrier protein
MTPSNSYPLTRERFHNFLWILFAKHSRKKRRQLDARNRLAQDLGLDRGRLVELNLELEDAFGEGIPEDLLDHPDLTLGEVEDALAAKCQ